MPYIDPMDLRRGVDLNTSVLSEVQGSLYEINQNYHTLASSLISPKMGPI